MVNGMGVSTACEQPCMHNDESSSHPACTSLRYTFIPSWCRMVPTRAIALSSTW
jgi:hypothetical protein